MSLPPVAADVTAEAVAALPARLRGRLDAAVEQARAWAVDRSGNVVTVRPDDQVAVTLTLPVVQAGNAVCSCLLAPRCLHRAAVLSAAPILKDAPDPAGDRDDDPALDSPAPDSPASDSPTPNSPASDSPAPGGPAPGGPAPNPTDGPTADPADDSAAVPNGASAPSAATSPAAGLRSHVESRVGEAQMEAENRADKARAKRQNRAVEAQAEAENRANKAQAKRQNRANEAPVNQARAKAENGVSEAQVAAAELLWGAAARLLGVGVPGGGAVAQADLLRAGHEARAVGLHAASAAAIRVVELLRALRREEPGARLGELTDDLRELLTTCHRLAGRDAAAIGVARRGYAPVGDLRLYGLFCEPVQAATGHAGAVTYLADERGRIWTVSDVKPADPPVARGATRASVQLGEVRLSHHDLARAGLRAINAHASDAGRLSHGRARQAVAAEGAGWFEAPLDALWQVDPADQVERWLATAQRPHRDRRAGGPAAAHDLAFLDGTIAGLGHDGLRLHQSSPDRPGGVVTVTPPIEDPAFPYVTNLRLLAEYARGHRVRLVGRFTGPRQVAALAIAAPWLRDHHVDLGAQTLTRADLPGARTTDVTEPPMPPSPPLHLLRHLLERVVATGRPALLSGTADDARVLASAQLGAAAALVTGLGAAGVRRTRDVFGRLDPHDPGRLALAWLAAAIYERGATGEVTRTAWRRPRPGSPPGA
ncbi:hypothetical protein [Actinoplanes sp. NPDC051411]|uniref:hypothetical protein n=1 Tax=Actinoplanes sp. NPDC051411 TaxID=3155522 RepID=UPI003445597D